MKYILSLPDTSIEHSDMGKYRKENHYSYSLLVIAINKNNEIANVIDARFYHTASRSYCCVWIDFVGGLHLRGGAYVGGTGFHRDSASLECALLDCGIKVKDLEGRGDHAMESALLELAEKFDSGYSNFTVIKAHG